MNKCVVTIVCVYLDSLDAVKSCIAHTVKPLAAHCENVVCAGFLTNANWWPLFEEASVNVRILPFKDNSGKSAYIRASIDLFAKPLLETAPDHEVYVCTVDCDIAIDMLLCDGMLKTMVQVIDDPFLRAGIVAPQQMYDNRHLSTVYANVGYSIEAECAVYWSDDHPSIAGGMWMFPLGRVYERVRPDRRFPCVGPYGPEDVLFALEVQRSLRMRCLLVPSLSVEHCYSSE